MTGTGIATFLAIHLLPLIVGVAWYLNIFGEMRRKNLDALVLPLFVVFVNYGGLLLVLLTIFLWFWSGMASLSTFYLIFVAPFIMGFIASRIGKMEMQSKYKVALFRAAMAYFAIMPVCLGTAFAIVYFLEK